MQGETELGDNLPPPGLQDQSIIIIIITIRMIIIIHHGNDDDTIKLTYTEIKTVDNFDDGQRH